MVKQEGIHHGGTEHIRLLDLLPSPHGVLRAFCAGCCALHKMHATIGRKRTREEKSLRVSVVRFILFGLRV